MASRLLWASRAASYLRLSVSHRGFASGIFLSVNFFFISHLCQCVIISANCLFFLIGKLIDLYINISIKYILFSLVFFFFSNCWYKIGTQLLVDPNSFCQFHWFILISHFLSFDQSYVLIWGKIGSIWCSNLVWVGDLLGLLLTLMICLFFTSHCIMRSFL